MKGSRVQAVIRELRGEKIDIVQFDDDPSNYVRNALNPAAINRVGIRDYEMRDMEVIVSEDQLSLAIGKRGQNVRLASKLVGWNLDIKSELEKKEEVEAEMERMARASQELGMLPGIGSDVVTRLLDAGFRALEEITMASLDDLTSIEGIDEDTAIDIHDAAEQLVEQLEAEAAEQAEQEDGEDTDGESAGEDETAPAEVSAEATAEATAEEEAVEAAPDEDAPVSAASSDAEPEAAVTEAAADETEDDTKES